MNNLMALRVIRKIVDAIVDQADQSSTRAQRYYSIARKIQSLLMEVGINEN